MTDLAAWLLEQIAEDERAALAASPGPWRPNVEHDEVLAVDDETVCDGFALSNRQLRATVEHIAAWDPVRVLAGCDAKRRLVELHASEDVDGRLRDGEEITVPVCVVCRDSNGMREESPCPTLRLLAVPLADRPGYREEWRP
jgi:hypothetical protein